MSGDQYLEKCVVWTTIPMLSWICPIIGHVGIYDSSGVVYDFEGPQCVGRGHLLFGKPLQVWRLDIDDQTLDRAIANATEEFSQRNYNIITSNCHFYVASVLRNAHYPLPSSCCSNWTSGATVKIMTGLVLHGRSISLCKFAQIWIPFLILWGIIILIILLSRRI